MTDEQAAPGSRRDRQLSAIACGALLLFATGCWLAAFEPFLVYPDAYDYAQMGREIRRGHGFATQQTFPRHIPTLAELGYWQDAHWPNLYRYPITPLLTAGVLTVVDDPVRAAVIQSGLWFLITAPLIFVLARRFANPGVAAFCALVVVADPRLLDASHSGMTETFGALLIAIFFLSAHRQPGTSWKWLLTGGVCGLAYLTRTQLAALLPIGLIYAWTSANAVRRRNAVALVLAGAAIAVLPWTVRNTVVAGDPAFSFSTSRNLMKGIAESDLELDLKAPATAASFLQSHGTDILDKWRANLAQLFEPGFRSRILGPWLSHVLIPFLVVCFIPTEDEDFNRFGRLAALFVVATFVVTALAFHRDRFYDPLRPILLTVACIGCWKLLCRWRRLRASRSATGALLALAIAAGAAMCVRTTLSRIDATPATAAREQVHQRAQARVRQIVPRGAIVASDVSFRVALDADRRAIRLPRDPNQLWEITEEYGDVDFILIGDLAPRGLNQYVAGAYLDFTRSPEFHSRYELAERLPAGGLLYARRGRDLPDAGSLRDR